LVNQQLRAARRKLDELCDQLIPSEEDEPGQQCEQRDAVILRSMPGLGRIILAVLLAEVWQPLRRRDYHAFAQPVRGGPGAPPQRQNLRHRPPICRQ
jgi:transposase